MNIWLAFADFFCALGLLIFALYAGRTKELGVVLSERRDVDTRIRLAEQAAESRVRQELGKQILEAQDVLRIKKEAKEVVNRVYHRLKDQKGWERLARNQDTYSISIPEAALFPLGGRAIQSPERLHQLALAIQAEGAHFGQFILVITGHTDDYPPKDKTLDSKAFNMTLSEDRAKVVAELLRKNGLDPSIFRIAMRGLGPTNPVVGNCLGESSDARGYHCSDRGLQLKPPDETERNRRIELTLGIYSPATGAPLP